MTYPKSKYRKGFQKCNFFMITNCPSYRFQSLHILYLLEMAATLILSHFQTITICCNNAHWKCWENCYYNSQFPRATSIKYYLVYILRTKIEKRRAENKTYTPFFYLFVGFE